MSAVVSRGEGLKNVRMALRRWIAELGREGSWVCSVKAAGRIVRGSSLGRAMGAVGAEASLSVRYLLER